MHHEVSQKHGIQAWQMARPSQFRQSDASCTLLIAESLNLQRPSLGKISTCDNKRTSALRPPDPSPRLCWPLVDTTKATSSWILDLRQARGVRGMLRDKPKE